jgi:hypothetical protein
MVVPPSGEAEYVIQLIPTDTEHAAATDAAAVQELRELVKGLAPAMEPSGNVDTIKGAGLPVAGVVYSGQSRSRRRSW